MFMVSVESLSCTYQMDKKRQIKRIAILVYYSETC